MPNLRYRSSAPTYVDGDLADGLTDSAGRQIVVMAGNTASTIGHGSRTVATAGTDLQLSASSVPCRWVTIEAYRSNTGIIAVGGSGVDAVAAGTGMSLAAGEAVSLDASNLNTVYIDATVNGEGVRYTYGA